MEEEKEKQYTSLGSDPASSWKSYGAQRIKQAMAHRHVDGPVLPLLVRSRPCQAFVLSLLLGMVLVLSLTPARADQMQPDPSRGGLSLSEEPTDSGWSFQFDNDLFVGGNRDRDYTGGFAVTLSGNRTESWGWSPSALRRWADDRLSLPERLGGMGERHSRHALEWGAALFTPDDISQLQANQEDRPYASLFFLNSTEQTVYPERSLSIKTSLTLGVLGLDLADEVQSGIHKVLGSTEPLGWDNQISSGGEPTARYAVSLQNTALLRQYANGMSQEFNWTAEADVGFTTGLSGGFNWRFGYIGTPWWTFNPHQSEYLNLGSNLSAGVSTGAVRERYVYVGSSMNLNLYNAFLQGQFRDSPVQVDTADVEALSADVWAGASVEVVPGFHLEGFVRARTREIDLPEASAPRWAGFIIRRTLP